MGELRAQEITQALSGTPWHLVVGRLHAHFATGDFARGLELVTRIAAAAEAADHHPDVDLRYGTVTVVLVSHDVAAVTERDVALASEIAAAAAELGVAGAPGSPEELEIAVDALDIPAVRPFWAAALGYVDVREGDDRLRDPGGRGPTLWFQQMEEPRPQRNRIHLDVTVAYVDASARIDEVLAAGGHLVSADAAPRFWVLADAEGNEVCLCTPQGRD